jgi:hypothetical protein
MKVARYDPAGGAIIAGVACDPNRNGSYTIMLWEAGKNEIVKEYPGNFINTDDDEHELDGPNSEHDGRLVEALVVVSVPSGVGPSDVTLTISQDDTELARDEQAVPPGSPGQLVDLFIRLAAR